MTIWPLDKIDRIMAPTRRTSAPAAPRLMLPLVLALGAAGLSGVGASTAPMVELIDAGGKLASASEITSLLR